MKMLASFMLKYNIKEGSEGRLQERGNRQVKDPKGSEFTRKGRSKELIKILKMSRIRKKGY